MSVLGDFLTGLLERGVPRLSLPGADARSPIDLARALMDAPGEDAQRGLAATLLDHYASLDDAGRRAFFLRLSRGLDVDGPALRAALDAYEAAPGRATYRAFAVAAEPARQELIRRVNRVTGATGRIVQMRADLLRAIAAKGEGTDALAALDEDFRHLLSSWFNRGFLVLRPITWDTPASILEKIIAYEAVHDIAGWEDLRRRLAPADRRCFAFFHPAMPSEPLIFVEVALTQGIPDSVQAILAPDRTPRDDVDTACFYSISNCQPGLAGISFGNSLIKQVVADLREERPDLSDFVTLSPIPGLATWAAESGEALDTDPRRLAARYLLTAKDARGRPRDPVARFHLGNGASVHAVHAEADLSPRGQTQSGGAMVNYRYDPALASVNHERYAATGAVAARADLRALAARAPSVA
ncbi:malonyl-CoA decarboxylase [Jannaschia sp.]|nr:malonyl-CoA decarboxylase [Jannaschia sp.]